MYQISGLAEIVRDPSKVTLQYLRQWFTSASSLGKGLKLIGWPVVHDTSPLLVWNKSNGLRVDLEIEEKIMYSNTLLRYIKVKDDYKLAFDYKRLLSLKKLLGTAKAIWSQAKLLINYQKTYDLAKSYVESIPTKTLEGQQTIEKALQEDVWPRVIAIDYIGEFVYSAMTTKLNDKQKSDLIQKLHARSSPLDWYTQALTSWAKVQEGVMSENEFVSSYGFIAGDDYELTKPRYYEILKRPKPVSQDYAIRNMNITNIEDLYVGLQYLRSQAKRRSLIWISLLRDEVIRH